MHIKCVYDIHKKRKRQNDIRADMRCESEKRTDTGTVFTQPEKMI